MSDSAVTAIADFTDSALWSKLLHRGSADQEPAVFTSAAAARRGSNISSRGAHNNNSSAFESISRHAPTTGISTTARPLSATASSPVPVSAAASSAPAAAAPALYERDLFLVMSKPVLETLVLLWEHAHDDQLVCRLFQGLWDFMLICIHFNLQHMLSRYEIVYISFLFERVN